MKTTLVRAAVLTLALVGFGSASVINKAETAKADAAKKPSTILAGVVPMPMCGPNNGCGMD